jgi:hypothetical protein
MLLFQQFDLDPALFPGIGDEARAAVGRGFFGAGRFHRDKGFEHFEHGWDPGFQGAQNALRFYSSIHDQPMLAKMGQIRVVDPVPSKDMMRQRAQSAHRNSLGITYNSGFGGEPGKTLGVSATESLG